MKRRERMATDGSAVTRLTFTAAAREVLDDYRMNGRRSLVDVQRHVRLHLAPFFGRRRMAAITTVTSAGTSPGDRTRARRTRPSTGSWPP